MQEGYIFVSYECCMNVSEVAKNAPVKETLKQKSWLLAGNFAVCKSLIMGILWYGQLSQNASLANYWKVRSLAEVGLGGQRRAEVVITERLAMRISYWPRCHIFNSSTLPERALLLIPVMARTKQQGTLSSWQGHTCQNLCFPDCEGKKQSIFCLAETHTLDISWSVLKILCGFSVGQHFAIFSFGFSFVPRVLGNPSSRTLCLWVSHTSLLPSFVTLTSFLNFVQSHGVDVCSQQRIAYRRRPQILR